MISVMHVVLFTAQLTHVGNAIAVRNDIAAEFHGYYSFTGPDGDKAELIGVGENGIGSFGTGTGCAHIIELGCTGYTVNIPCDLRFVRREGLVILVSTPGHQKWIVFANLKEPRVLQGEFSRALLN